MNHFGAQAHIDIQNKVENSVQNCLTVLKANKNGSLHQNWIIHLLSAFEVFLPYPLISYPNPYVLISYQSMRPDEAK